MDFGIILSQLRIERNLSQKELADELNISSGSIGMWETHKRLPSLYMLAKIAQYFNVTTDYLLGISSEPTTQSVNCVHLTDDELRLIDTYRCLSPDAKPVVLGKALDLKISAMNTQRIKKDIG